MASWIRADYDFSRHIANVALDRTLFATLGLDWSALGDDPDLCAHVLRRMISTAEDGRYRHADVWRLFQDARRAQWLVTICHPALPALAEGGDVPILSLAISAEECERLRATLFLGFSG